MEHEMMDFDLMDEEFRSYIEREIRMNTFREMTIEEIDSNWNCVFFEE